jgi:hypothetical protein
MKIECYEIPNTFTRDLPLDEQIALGICDWRCEGNGLIAFGHSEAEARANYAAL